MFSFLKRMFRGEAGALSTKILVVGGAIVGLGLLFWLIKKVFVLVIAVVVVAVLIRIFFGRGRKKAQGET